MYVCEIEFGSPLYAQTIELREELLRIPLGLQFSPEELMVEMDQMHIACYNSMDELLGCLVLIDLGNHTVKMRQVAVNQKIQSNGIGTFLVKETEQICKKKGYNHIVLNARETAVNFYEKMKYSVISDRFEEVSIPHFKMEKYLEIE